MTYHRPLFTGNVLTVRLSCEKNLKKKQGKKISKKITVREKKSRSGMNIYPWVIYKLMHRFPPVGRRLLGRRPAPPISAPSTPFRPSLCTAPSTPVVVAPPFSVAVARAALWRPRVWGRSPTAGGRGGGGTCDSGTSDGGGGSGAVRSLLVPLQQNQSINYFMDI